MSLTPHMVKLLHVARSKTCMDEETYRALLSRFGAKSSKDKVLQPAHYFEMMKVFAQMGFVPAAKPATPAGGSRGQVREIERLCRQHQVDEHRFRGILKHVTGRDALKWCDRRDLSKLIQALRRWNYGTPGPPAGGEESTPWMNP